VGVGDREQMMDDVVEWIKRELRPVEATSAGALYDAMESQSGRSLPIIYEPFDPGKRSHWRDRGALLDFLVSTEATGETQLLDFGPGDGWPSLVIAPDVREVVGIDGSQRRVRVCTENAARLGIFNATFRHVAPGAALPFGVGRFDAVVAASSVEQTPDPRATLRELHRVLRPGGRLRIRYEALSTYLPNEKYDVATVQVDDRTSRLVLYARELDDERVHHFALTIALPSAALTEVMGVAGRRIAAADLTVSRLVFLRELITESSSYTLHHPSGETLVHWLSEIGFRAVRPTHDGIWFAGEVFDRLPMMARPATLDEVDAYLHPIVGTVVQMAAPASLDPMITAVK
jgi:SAM-dependent methyltransferase